MSFQQLFMLEDISCSVLVYVLSVLVEFEICRGLKSPRLWDQTSIHSYNFRGFFTCCSYGYKSSVAFSHVVVTGTRVFLPLSNVYANMQWLLSENVYRVAGRNWANFFLVFNRCALHWNLTLLKENKSLNPSVKNRFYVRLG